MAVVEYRNLQVSEVEAVRELFESYYGPQVYCTQARYFDWLHARSPMHELGATAEEFTVLSAIDEGRLLGCICYLPTRVYAGGREHTAVVTTESLARPEARGVYGLLARRLIGRFDYCFMMGATAFLRDLYVRQLRAQYRHDITRWLLIGELSALRTLCAGAPELPEGDPEQLRAWSQLARELATQHRSQVIEPGDLDQLYWHEQLASGHASLCRSRAWIEWRYCRHPHIQYTLLSTDAAQTGGLAVLRHELPRGLNVPVLRLLEFLPTRGHELALAGAVANFFARSGAALLDFFCAHERWDNLLPPAFVRPAQHRPHRIPYLLQPPEWRERDSINLLSVRNRAKRRELGEIACDGLYLTKGDGGQDIALNEGYASAHLREHR